LILNNNYIYPRGCVFSQAHPFLLISGKPLREPVAWGGPIVMNTREELEQAFDELDKGTFIRKT